MLWATVVLSALLIRFPGTSHEASSPDRRVALRWEEASGDHPHRVWIRVGGREAVLVDFPRAVTLAWSPDSRFIALTNYEGSSDASLHLFTASAEPREIPLRLPRRAMKILKNNHHAYAEVQKWQEGRLIARVWGYGAHGDREESLIVRCAVSGRCE